MAHIDSAMRLAYHKAFLSYTCIVSLAEKQISVSLFGLFQGLFSMSRIRRFRVHNVSVEVCTEIFRSHQDLLFQLRLLSLSKESDILALTELEAHLSFSLG